MGDSQDFRALAGAGLMLALVLVGLCLVGLADPVAGRAAVASEEDQPAPDAIEATAGPSSTVFLPLIIGPALTISNVWQAEYYDGTNLIGEPAHVQEEARVDYGWGTGGPFGDLGDDYYSARWSGHWQFEAGEYTFFLYADDGVRLWLDDTSLVDDWGLGMHDRQVTVNIDTEGLHHLKVEYYENTGDAAIHLRWRRTDLNPQWRGKYYQNPWVEGDPLYQQNDSSIQFEWYNGGPSGLPADGFSVAWDAEHLLEAGTHRIFFYADEGYQLYVDGTKVKEGGWYDGQSGGSMDDVYVLDTTSLGTHNIIFNFHDRGTLAEARLWIVNMEHPYWNVELYTDMNLSNWFKDDDGYKVFFDWKLGKPLPWSKMPSDHFSIRWSGMRYFHAGCYRFGLFADDGVRLWVDGELLVNEWHVGRGEYHSPYTYLSSGYHDVVIEYFEDSGEAEIRYWYE